MQQIEGLEDVADGRGPQPVALRFSKRGHLPAGNGDAAGVRLENAGNQMEESGLARAAFALKRDLGLFGQAETRHIDDAMLAPSGETNDFLRCEISSSGMGLGELRVLAGTLAGLIRVGSAC